MADISMCLNKECPSFKLCYRAQAKPCAYGRQAYDKYTPNESGKCAHFYEFKIKTVELEQ